MNKNASRRWGITTRTMIVVSVVATVAVLVAGVASFPFVRAAAEGQAQGELASLADVTAAYVDRPLEVRERLLPRPLARVLGREQIAGYLVGVEGQAPPGIPASLVQRVFAGESVSARARGDDGTMNLIEGRPTFDGALFLVQPVTAAQGVTAIFLARIVGALALGLVIAIAIGFGVARRLSRPLRAAQGAALRMASGSREEQLPIRGPAEVADIAAALNALNAALVSSEGRQREFLLSVSHELRTPLTAVQGYGEALSDGMVSEESLSEVGRTIAAEAKRLHRLVSDLLDLARLGAVDFHVDAEDLDLSLIVVDAARVWQDRCAQVGVEVQTVGAQSATFVHADATRVRQIIDNLMENALRVSPSGSTIRIAVHRDPTVAAGPFVVLEVKDCGPGLSADDVAVAFEPGALHERYRGVRPVGTGLGLALVARLAERMGGSAAVTSTPGEGTSMWVRLPIART